MVSSLAPAISYVGLDAADHHLDREHYPHLRHVALARPWAPVGVASWLGDGGGIRFCGNGRCNYCLAQAGSVEGASMLNRTGSVNPFAATPDVRIRKPGEPHPTRLDLGGAG